MTDAQPEPPLTWSRANLPRDRAAALLALGDGLAAIGRLRSGRRAGQLSVFNFRLRAAGEDPKDPYGPLVVLMRAGTIRRHTFFCRYTPPPPDDPQALPSLALPGPIDRDWDWWPAFEEVRDRIIDQPVWLQAVGAPYGDRLAAYDAALDGAQLVEMQSLTPPT